MQYYITTISVNSVGDVIDDYGTGLGGRGELIETDIEEVLKHNYKLVDGKLIKLTVEEKVLIVPPQQPNKIDILEQENKVLKSQMLNTQKLCVGLQKQILLK